MTMTLPFSSGLCLICSPIYPIWWPSTGRLTLSDIEPQWPLWLIYNLNGSVSTLNQQNSATYHSISGLFCYPEQNNRNTIQYIPSLQQAPKQCNDSSFPVFLFRKNKNAIQNSASSIKGSSVFRCNSPRYPLLDRDILFLQTTQVPHMADYHTRFSASSLFQKNY